MERAQKFEHKKSLGQHFLNNDRIPKKMVEAGEVTKDDTVLEIGPGTGILTREILLTGADVIAIEADGRAVSVLHESFTEEVGEGKLRIIHGDVRTLDMRSLGLKSGKFKVVANIPYYISGILFRTFLESKIQPKTLVFLVQREVAERIVRDPKESLLSLSVKIFGDPKYITTVKPGNFTPPPKVDSAIIAIYNISKKRLGNVSEKDFFSLIHEGFKSKRKQLLPNLSSLFTRETLTHTFSTLGIDAKARGEDLPLPVWLRLIETLVPRK